MLDAYRNLLGVGIFLLEYMLCRIIGLIMTNNNCNFQRNRMCLHLCAL